MRANKAGKISLFYLIIAIILLSSLSVFLISNVIAINSLSREINIVKDNLGIASEMNNVLNIEIGKLSSFGRIKTIAEERLGMKVNESAIIKEKYFKSEPYKGN